MRKSQPTLKATLTPGAYAISINPQNQSKFQLRYWENFTTKSYVLGTLQNNARKITDIFGNTASFLLYPDISSPEQMYEGKIPRVHYHGIVYIHHPLLFHLITAQHLNNHKTTNKFSIELDTIEDLIYWVRYCTKSKPLFGLKYFFNSRAEPEYIYQMERSDNSESGASESSSDSES